MTRRLIVTPTYNERDNLERFVDSVLSVRSDVDIAIVDDASPDGTGELADTLAAKHKNVLVHHRAEKLGLGSAYIFAFSQALKSGYEQIFEMDADLSHDPEYLPAFFEAFEKGADVVIGSRNVSGGGVEGWGPHRHLLSKGGSLYSRTVLGVQVRDLTSGYKGFRADVLRSIDLSSVRSEGYSFQVELTYRAIRAGFTVTEVPIVFVDRQAGQSKMNREIFIEAITLVPKLRIDALLGKI